MRKLTEIEEWTLGVLRSQGSVCPSGESGTSRELRKVLDRMVKKGYVTVEPTQDGPRYHAA